ncbi:MAG: cytochrome c biogenesis protein ResB, partial [Campylobacter hyointestinalis]
MEVILNLKKILISYKFILFLLFLLGLGAGVATFLESIYDTQTAQILVYNALWYEILMFVLSLCLTLVIIHTKMWKHFGAFVLHLAFIVIIIGAFLTRHFGFEGILHIREGNSENEMLSVKPYFQIKSTNDTFIYPLNLSKLRDNYFSFTKEISSKKLTINFSAYKPAESKNERSTLVVEAYFDKEEPKTIDIKGGPGWFGEPHIVDLNGENIELSWGSKLIELPFSIKLVDFKLERYPGSMSPSSYASDIEILDKNKEKTLDYKIFMNNPLSFEGYKFFQSSY